MNKFMFFEWMNINLINLINLINPLSTISTC